MAIFLGSCTTLCSAHCSAGCRLLVPVLMGLGEENGCLPRLAVTHTSVPGSCLRDSSHTIRLQSGHRTMFLVSSPVNLGHYSMRLSGTSIVRPSTRSVCLSRPPYIFWSLCCVKFIFSKLMNLGIPWISIFHHSEIPGVASSVEKRSSWNSLG